MTEDAGNYRINLKCTYPKYELSLIQTFDLTVSENITTIDPLDKVNTGPYFVDTEESLPDAEVVTGEPDVVMFPKIKDDEGHDVEVGITFSNPNL